MRTTEVNGAIAQAVRILRILFSLPGRPHPEAISDIVDRMNYGKAPHHARRYVEGYAQALKDQNNATD